MLCMILKCRLLLRQKNKKYPKIWISEKKVKDFLLCFVYSWRTKKANCSTPYISHSHTAALCVVVSALTQRAPATIITAAAAGWTRSQCWLAEDEIACIMDFYFTKKRWIIHVRFPLFLRPTPLISNSNCNLECIFICCPVNSSFRIGKTILNGFLAREREENEKRQKLLSCWKNIKQAGAGNTYRHINDRMYTENV